MEISFSNFLFVGIGGAIGAICRFYLGIMSNHIFQFEFPFTTLIINIFGCTVLGLVVKYFSLFNTSNEALKIIITIGFLGGFTTFSAFSMEAFSLLSNEKYAFAVLYVFGSVLLSILGFTFGYFLISKNI